MRYSILYCWGLTVFDLSKKPVPRRGTLHPRIGMSLGISTNLEAVTAQYVDVRLERKKVCP